MDSKSTGLCPQGLESLRCRVVVGSQRLRPCYFTPIKLRAKTATRRISISQAARRSLAAPVTCAAADARRRRGVPLPPASKVEAPGAAAQAVNTGCGGEGCSPRRRQSPCPGGLSARYTARARRHTMRREAPSAATRVRSDAAELAHVLSGKTCASCPRPPLGAVALRKTVLPGEQNV